MVPAAHAYKSIVGQVIGKTQDGILIKTADTMLKITEYTYDGKIRVGDRLINHG